MKKLSAILVIYLLAGCAAQVPVPESKAPVANVTVAEVRLEVGRFDDTQVRWGGTIARVENKANETWIEIVSRPLRNSGQPRETGGSSGRFIAKFQQFMDPLVYQVDQQLTVLGSIKGQITRPIGEHDYTFPVVLATKSYLWPIETEPDYYDYPPPWWYYDPWPFYPWSHPYYYW